MEIRIGIVTGSRVATSGDGTEPGRILQAVVTDVHDTQAVQTCQAGDEYNPPDGATVVLVAGGQAYKLAVALDDGIAPVMAKGGRRIYAVDPTGAAEVCEVRLNPDGLIEVFNGEVALTLQPDGTARVENGAASFTMSPAGAFTFSGASSHFDHPVTMASTLEVTGDVAMGGTLDVADAITSEVSVEAPLVTGTANVVFAGIAATSHKHVEDGGGGYTGPALQGG